MKLRPIDCLDICNILGDIVVAGNVRLSADIAIGKNTDGEFLKAKILDRPFYYCHIILICGPSHRIKDKLENLKKGG